MTTAFKQKLQRGEVVTVINPDHPSPSLVEFVAGLGIDAIFIDCEHGVATIERVQEMARACRAASVQSILRPDAGEPWLMSRYLDAGAGGLMVPHVHTADAARAIVHTVRETRFRDHQTKVIVAMIESMTALQNLDEILKVDGIDVFFVGPGDLSKSMGRPGDLHHPEIRKLVADTIRRIRAAARAPGTLVVQETARDFVAAGCQFLYEHANAFLAAGARAYKAAYAGPSASAAPR